MNNTVIEKNIAYLVLTALWAWILLEIPFIIKLVQHLCIKYYYDDQYLYIKRGVIKKESHQVLLFKVQNFDATNNFIGDGTLFIRSTQGRYGMTHVKNVHDVRNQLVLLTEQKKEEKGVARVDAF